MAPHLLIRYADREPARDIFSMDASLLNLLVDDHERIREFSRQLKSKTHVANIDDEDCLKSFRNLKALVVAHAKAEEFILYSLFEQPENIQEEKLQHFAFEGYEEHDLIDYLMKEMVQAEELSHQWKAQLTVLTDMLDRHMKKDEVEFYPRVADLLGPEELIPLGESYAKERDVIFAKKSGIRPIVSIGHSALMNY